MGLLHPGQLVWLAMAVLILLLYLAGRRRAIDVSSHLLWRRTLARQSPWRRRQRTVSAAILAALLAMCAVALAEPYWRSEREAARTIALVLEPSGAGDAALSQVDQLKRYERMAVLGTAGAPHVICPLTDDKIKLRTAIQTLNVEKGGERGERGADAPRSPEVPQATAETEDLARWMLAEQQNPTIVVLAAGRNTAEQSADMASPSASPGAWLLGAALLLCGVEWVLFSRRVTV